LATNSPYPANVTAANMQGRLVSCGLRVRNTTPLLSRGGLCVGAESLTHTGMVNLTIPDLMAMDTTDSVPAASDLWSSVVWHPQDDDEFDYLDSSELTGDFLFPVLGFAFQGSPTVSQNYEFEVYVVFEAKGATVHGLTPSFADPVGMSAIQNTIASVAQRKPVVGDRDRIVSRSLLQASRASHVTSPIIRAFPPLAVQPVLRLPQLRNKLRQPRQPPRFQNRALADSTIYCAFPAICDPDVMLFVVSKTTLTNRFTRGVSSDGFPVYGYHGVLQMSVGCPIQIYRVDPYAYRNGRVVRLDDSPLCESQSLQLAVSKLSGPQRFDLAWSGSLADGVVTPSAQFSRKSSYCLNYGIRLCQSVDDS